MRSTAGAPLTRQVWPSLADPRRTARRADDVLQALVRLLACLLPVAAVVWVLLDPPSYMTCLTLAIAAIPLAIVGVAK